MTYFYALLHKDADNAFGVTFPDLPGCFSAADQFENVVPNAVQALELWFEDREDVKPSSLEQLHGAVAADLKAGAPLIRVPRKSTRT
jgi:predicted RNase H-like HicB family nuclease